jgi:uncharacterized protein
MNLKTIEKLCCPFDKSDLTLQIFVQDKDNVIEGLFTCKCCKRYYPIIYGIPIMSPDEYRELQLEQPMLDRWKKHLEGQNILHFQLLD